MLELLGKTVARGMQTKYLTMLLSAFDPQHRKPEPAPPEPPTALVEPLSPREREVWGLIANGASNPEIAQELYISVNTVKKHVTNIFGKLGAASRTQAVARGRELGLVE